MILIYKLGTCSQDRQYSRRSDCPLICKVQGCTNSEVWRQSTGNLRIYFKRHLAHNHAALAYQNGHLTRADFTTYEAHLPPNIDDNPTTTNLRQENTSLRSQLDDKDQIIAALKSEMEAKNQQIQQLTAAAAAGPSTSQSTGDQTAALTAELQKWKGKHKELKAKWLSLEEGLNRRSDPTFGVAKSQILPDSSVPREANRIGEGQEGTISGVEGLFEMVNTSHPSNPWFSSNVY